MSEPEMEEKSLNFIEQIIEKDLRTTPNLQVRLRFPPEPNGYLHLGHAKSLFLNFELAKKYGGSCHVRFDDTDPSKESEAYVRAISADIKWLGYHVKQVTYASDYFEHLYDYAVALLRMGKAYVDAHSSEAFAQHYKGTPTQAGKESPDRRRSIAENIHLFKEMRAGKHPPGSFILRAKIDMSAPNMHMRDPAMYRIKAGTHFRTADRWHIYPMYDFAHCLCDAIEGITHSLCSLEFEVHRPLYEWFLDTLNLSGPRQIEFARLMLSHTVLSKRKLGTLIARGAASGWDDPQLPTLSGLRRRGYNPAALQRCIHRAGLSKRKSLTDISLLHWALREDLNARAPRRMVILHPLKIIIENYHTDQEESLPAPHNPEDPSAGERMLPFGRELYIESDDFSENPPAKFFRLSPGREVRLKYAYIIRCEEAVRDEKGNILYLRCSYDPDTRSGTAGAARKVKGTLSWVSAQRAISAEVRQYATLFLDKDPETDSHYLEHLNPTAIARIQNAKLEPTLLQAKAGEVYQFERKGYYCKDPEANLFHESVSLRDSYAERIKK